MSVTDTTTQTLVWDNTDPGECPDCGLDIYETNNECDLGHGEWAAAHAVEDQCDFATYELDAWLDQCRGRRGGGWLVEGHNLGWQHRSGVAIRESLDGAGLVTLLQGGANEFRVELRRTGAHTLEGTGWHHDAPRGERYTITALTVAERDELDR